MHIDSKGDIYIYLITICNINSPWESKPELSYNNTVKEKK